MKKKIGHIEIKPAENGFLVVCNMIDDSDADPAQEGIFRPTTQELYVHNNAGETLMTIDRMLRTAEGNP